MVSPLSITAERPILIRLIYTRFVTKRKDIKTRKIGIKDKTYEEGKKAAQVCLTSPTFPPTLTDTPVPGIAINFLIQPDSSNDVKV